MIFSSMRIEMENFDLAKKVKELEKTYTKESVGKFLDDYMSNARYQGENSFSTFLKNTKLLVKKPGYVENGIPYLAISYSTFEKMREDNITFTEDERLEFEALMAYLVVEKGKPIQEVIEMNHKVSNYAKEKNISFMEAYKKVRSLKADKVKARLEEIVKQYKEENGELWITQ